MPVREIDPLEMDNICLFKKESDGDQKPVSQ